MKITLIWFSFSADESCLLQSLRAARHHAPDCRRLVISDGAFPLSEEARQQFQEDGITHWASGTDRRGNLNGLVWLARQWDWLSTIASTDWIVKIDSDTILNDHPQSWLQYARPNHAAVCAWQPTWWFQGPCYALRAAIPQTLRDHLAAHPQSLEHLAPRYPEDVCTAHTIAAVHGPAAILALPGGSQSTLFQGRQIAHYSYKLWPDFGQYADFKTIHFGNRKSLPPQMPDAIRRHTAARTMAAYLDSQSIPT